MAFSFEHKSYVAYFDLLGFANLVKSNVESAFRSLEDLWSSKEKAEKKLLSLYKNAKTNLYIALDFGRVKSYFFSDTILFYTHTDDFDDLISILGSSALLIAEAFYKGLPLRGGISHGDFFMDERRRIFCGIPMIQAYQISEESQWMGVVVADSVAMRYNDDPRIKRSGEGPPMLVKWNVNCKNEEDRKRWVINWITIPVLKSEVEIPMSMDNFYHVFKPCSVYDFEALSDYEKRKYRNTLDFVNSMICKYNKYIKRS